MLNCNWKLSNNSKKLKKKKNYFSTLLWRRPNSYHLSRRENSWQTRIWRRCSSTLTEFWIARLSIRNTSLTVIILKYNSLKKQQKTKSGIFQKKKKMKRKNKLKNHCSIFLLLAPKNFKIIQLHRLIGIP